MKAIINKIKVICRNCDEYMIFEEENPKEYFLFLCKYCGNKVGILLKKIC